MSDYKTVAELLADPARWTKGCAARGKSGREVDPRGRAAVSFCVDGAIDHVYQDSAEGVAAFKRATLLVRRRYGWRHVSSFNDSSRSHRAVLTFVRKAGI